MGFALYTGNQSLFTPFIGK